MPRFADGRCMHVIRENTRRAISTTRRYDAMARETRGPLRERERVRGTSERKIGGMRKRRVSRDDAKFSGIYSVVFAVTCVSRTIVINVTIIYRKRAVIQLVELPECSSLRERILDKLTIHEKKYIGIRYLFSIR